MPATSPGHGMNRVNGVNKVMQQQQQQQQQPTSATTPPQQPGKMMDVKFNDEISAIMAAGVVDVTHEGTRSRTSAPLTCVRMGSDTVCSAPSAGAYTNIAFRLRAAKAASERTLTNNPRCRVVCGASAPSIEMVLSDPTDKHSLNSGKPKAIFANGFLSCHGQSAQSLSLVINDPDRSGAFGTLVLEPPQAPCLGADPAYGVNGKPLAAAQEGRPPKITLLVPSASCDPRNNIKGITCVERKPVKAD
jgi:hypothetical protein